jgi:phosphohistidine phosphatase
MKTLLLLRHGIAEDPAAGQNDASRPLTAEGIKKTRQAAAGLARVIDPPDLILTSPKLRARHTADIVAAAFGLRAEPLDDLGAEAPDRILRKLQRYPQDTLLIVGHEPTFSRIVSLLCTADPDCDVIELKKAGCACVQFDPAPDSAPANPHARLLWLLPPAILRALSP